MIFAPSRASIRTAPRPMPLAAPVTKATFPSTRRVMSGPFPRRRRPFGRFVIAQAQRRTRPSRISWKRFHTLFY